MLMMYACVTVDEAAKYVKCAGITLSGAEGVCEVERASADSGDTAAYATSLCACEPHVSEWSRIAGGEEFVVVSLVRVGCVGGGDVFADCCCW